MTSHRARQLPFSSKATHAWSYRQSQFALLLTLHHPSRKKESWKKPSALDSWVSLVVRSFTGSRPFRPNSKRNNNEINRGVAVPASCCCADHLIRNSKVSWHEFSSIKRDHVETRNLQIKYVCPGILYINRDVDRGHQVDWDCMLESLQIPRQRHGTCGWIRRADS